MKRLIDADAIDKRYVPIASVLCGDGVHYEWVAFVEDINEQPTIDAVPLSVVRKAAKKLAYIHQQIDLYGDRPDLHEEEYWLEYLMDEEWKDEEID